MYSVNEAIMGIKNPRLGVQPIARKLHDFYFTNVADHTGEDYMAADWDNLIILDACRYDLFEEANQLPGELSAVQSPACETEEFLRKLMDGKSFPDTVYVTANPQITKIDAEFAGLHCLWEPLWNDEHDTVMPGDVTDYVQEIAEEYDDKRLIVHYIQPHVPFIGPTAAEIEQQPFEGNTLDNATVSEKTAWKQLMFGEISKEKVWRAYRESLEIALDAADPLFDSLDGKTVVTSDHGNAAGEWAVFGHPPNRYLNCITTVPWLELPYDSRKEITPSETTESVSQVSQSDVEERLEHLGYV